MGENTTMEHADPTNAYGTFIVKYPFVVIGATLSLVVICTILLDPATLQLDTENAFSVFGDEGK
jgi:hypothetical protein